jgi:hypothetical protein
LKEQTPVRSLRAGDFFLSKGVRMTGIRFHGDDDVREVVEKFERCEYAPEEFTHSHHLAAACWYSRNGLRSEALAYMRSSLLRFTAHHKKQAYHETITRFWVELVGDFLGRISDRITLHERVNLVVEAFADKELIFRYYSRDLVMSDQARREWVEPDLRPIHEKTTSHQTTAVTRNASPES